MHLAYVEARSPQKLLLVRRKGVFVVALHHNHITLVRTHEAEIALMANQTA